MCGRDGTGSTAKCLMITFNCICIIFGIGCLALGIWTYIDSQSLAGALGNIPLDNDQKVTEAVDTPSLLERGQWALIAGGGVTIIVSIIGCIGAMRESKVMLIFYAVIVIIVILLEIGAGVIVIFFRETLDDVLKDHLFNAMAEYKKGLVLGDRTLTESENDIEKGWDVSQITLECCGVNNYEDWIEKEKNVFSATYKGKFCGEDIDEDSPVVPLSCCKTTNPHRYPEYISELYFVNITGCLSDPTPQNANLDGCYDAILKRMEMYTLVISVVCLGVGFLQFGVVVAAFFLACRNKGKADEEED